MATSFFFPGRRDREAEPDFDKEDKSFTGAKTFNRDPYCFRINVTCVHISVRALSQLEKLWVKWASDSSTKLANAIIKKLTRALISIKETEN